MCSWRQPQRAPSLPPLCALTQTRCGRRGTSRRGCSCRSARQAGEGHLRGVGVCWFAVNPGGTAVPPPQQYRTQPAQTVVVAPHVCTLQARRLALQTPCARAGGPRFLQRSAARRPPPRDAPSFAYQRRPAVSRAAPSTHLLHVGAGNAGVVVQAGVPPHSLLPGMSKGADGPIVHKALGAGDDLR